MVTVGEPVPLRREDAGLLFLPAYKPVVTTEKLRRQHHRIARFSARGFRQFEIAEMTGYSPTRISILLTSPAMVELVSYYSSLITEEFKGDIDEFHSTSIRNMQRAEDLIADRLEEAEAEGIALPLRDLIAISGDRADRFGYPKRQINDNRNTNFAELLEKMNERAKGQIDATPAD